MLNFLTQNKELWEASTKGNNNDAQFAIDNGADVNWKHPANSVRQKSYTVTIPLYKIIIVPDRFLEFRFTKNGKKI